MTTIGDVVDRTLREWLVPPDDQPLRFTLAEPLTDSDTSLTYDASLMPPEVEELLGPGTLIEVGLEQILVGDSDPSSHVTSGLIRATNGTTPAAHDAGTLATIAPTFSRLAVFEAISDAVENLHPPLFQVKSTAIDPTSSGWVEAPADMLVPQAAYHVSGMDVTRLGVRLLTHFPQSSTGKAVEICGSRVGGEVNLTYRAEFDRPTSESDTLTDLGVETSWTPILMVDVVAALITSRDVEQATQEHLVSQLAQEGFPVGTGSRLRDSLVGLREFYVQRAIRRLRARNGNINVVDGVVV